MNTMRIKYHSFKTPLQYHKTSVYLYVLQCNNGVTTSQVLNVIAVHFATCITRQWLITQ
jgi:hypothetical protein